MSQITQKIYYRITFRLASALSVGSGENRYSDSDMIRDSAGDPFIPGSSLAGLYRSLLNKTDGDRYFGTSRNQDQGEGSKILVYDAKLCGGENKADYRSNIRDCVGLDSWKTAKPGCKFDFEVIEPGAQFVTYLEQNCESKDKDIGEELALAWKNHQIRIGRKTMRGLGAIGDTVICRKSFNMEEDLEQWLDFDMYRDEDWKDTEFSPGNKGGGKRREPVRVEMNLRQKGGISVRRYTTRVSAGTIQPDAEQLTCIRNQNGEEIPYIPGTSWAGTFCHHMEKLIPGCTEAYFGTCEKRSFVYFGESFIEGAFAKALTRNAVDRFTGGVIENVLFSEKMWYGGKTILHIEIPEETDLKFKQALAASLVDLHMGLMAVGGLTSVGRGIFEVEELKIDGEEVPVSKDMYGEILEKLKRR